MRFLVDSTRRLWLFHPPKIRYNLGAQAQDTNFSRLFPASVCPLVQSLIAQSPSFCGSFPSPPVDMTPNKTSPSWLGRSLSFQSCFPETKSNDASGCKSPENNDITMYIDPIYYGDGTSLNKFEHGHLPTSPSSELPVAEETPDISDLCPRYFDAQSSRILVRQNDSDLASGLEVQGSDVHVSLNESMRQVGPGNPLSSHTPIFELKRHVYDGQTSFPLATVPYSGTISGEIRTCGLRSYVVLYLAALRGDWEIAREFLDSNPVALRARITRGLETALHVAAGASHTRFVEDLVKLMRPEDLALQNKVGNTALCFAAASGVRKIAELMVEKNKELPSIRGSKGALPLYMAALLGHRDMVWYLYSVTEHVLTEEDRICLLNAAITANLFDVALDIVQRHPALATARDGNGDTALHVLARKPSAFPSGNHLTIWQRCLYSCIQLELRSKFPSPYSIHEVPILKALLRKVPKFLGFEEIYDKKLMHILTMELAKQLWDQILLLDDSKIGELIRTPSRLLFTVAELGIVEFIIVLVRSYPDLIWKVDDQSRSIFHVAVAYRQEKIFNFIYDIGALKDLIAAYKDENNINMLHLAGKLAPSNRLNIDSGAALQLRRELRWFKEVEKIVQPLYTEMKDPQGRTPQILFTEEHKGLVREGEKWMKDTASSCMLVATLIATVMFAAVCEVPGRDSESGSRNPRKSFMVFLIADAMALFSSSTSILIFLSILTSRYAEEDFLDSLPNRLTIGLGTLFISIATMMISFCATLFIVLRHDRLAWVDIPMTVIASIPAISFALLQFPLFVDVVSHTCMSSTIFRRRNHLLY